MKSRLLYIILGISALGGVALIFFNGGVLQDIAQNCSSDANRPCFEQETANNLQAAAGSTVKKEKLDTERGQTEFAACIKNEANRRGEEKGRTKICDAEIIKYCEDAWNDDKNNKNNENRRIKKYEGKCEPEPGPTPTPTPNSKAVSITTASLPTATLQMRYRAELGTNGGTAPYTWSISSGVLPTGITLDAKTGIISGLLQHVVHTDGSETLLDGSVALPGTATITFGVVDAVGSRATKKLSLVIQRIVEPVFDPTFLLVTKGEDKIGWGSRLSQINLSDSDFLPFTDGAYPFWLNELKTMYYLKYGSGAQPDHLSIMISDLVAPEILGKTLDIQITTDTGPKIVYFPAVPACDNDQHRWQFYIAKDGSTYYVRSDHICGIANLSPEEALVPQHLARGASATPDLSARPSSPTDFSPNSMRSSMIPGAEIIKITPATPTVLPSPSPTPTPITQSCVLTVSIAQTTPPAQTIRPGQTGVNLVKFNATPNCDGTLKSFAVSLLPMLNGYQNISTLRLYDDVSGVQLGTTQSVTTAGMNFPSVNIPLTDNQTLVLRVVGDVSPSAGIGDIGSTVYGVFGGSWGTTSLGGAIGNNASGNLISGNTMTVVR